MWQTLCEVIKQGLSIEDILQTINTNTVCTNVQCFDSLEDAGFGIAPHHEEINYTFLIPFVVLLFYVVMNVPGSVHNTKPSISVSRINDII